MRMTLENISRIVFLVLLSVSGSVNAYRLDGQAHLYGEVLASACTIALSDRFQSVEMGDLALRDFQRGRDRPAREFVIHLDNCITTGEKGRDGRVDPPVRVRFDGLPGAHPGMFRTLGDAGGVALVLWDDRHERVYPGEYLPAVYQKAWSQQALRYRIELVPDGNRMSAGDYSAALRFSVDYE